MEPKHSNPNETIESGIAYWRTYPVPPVPTVLPNHSAPARRSSILILRWSAPVLACVAVGAALLWPTNSLATGLARTLSAFDAIKFHKQHQVCTNELGQQTLMSDIWTYGADYHMRTSGASNGLPYPIAPQDLWLVHGVLTNYLPKNGYASRHRINRTGTLGFSIDFKTIIKTNGHGGVKEYDNQKWHDQSVIRFALNTGPFKDGAGVTQSVNTTLLVDAKSYLPLEVFSHFPGQGTSVIDFEYPQFDPRLIAVNVPDGVPIYDLDVQREEIKERSMTPISTAHVAGRTITLRTLVVDHSGVLAAWISGGAPRPSTARELLRVDGLTLLEPTEEPGSPTWDSSGIHGTRQRAWSTSREAPEMFRGVPLIKETQSFARDTTFPPRLTVRIPVWGNEGDKPLGWAIFKNVKPTLTGSTPELMWPMNRDIFITPPRP